jgi:hypothetical protein
MKLTDLNRASSIAAIDRIYESDPDLFAIGAEYDQGYDPQSLQTANDQWNLAMERYKSKLK